MDPIQNRFGYGAQAQSAALFDEGLRQHMLRVYNYMGLGLVITGIVAYVVGTTPALYVPIFQTPLKWVVMLAPLAFILFFNHPANPLGERKWVIIGGSYLKPGSNALTREWTDDRSLRRADLGFRVVFEAN